MGLKLTGKGSILDAIGGALSTGANDVIGGVKDVSDDIFGNSTPNVSKPITTAPNPLSTPDPNSGLPTSPSLNPLALAPPPMVPTDTNDNSLLNRTGKAALNEGESLAMPGIKVAKSAFTLARDEIMPGTVTPADNKAAIDNLGSTAKSFAQFIPRAGAQVGLTVAAPFTNSPTSVVGPKFTNPILKDIFGSAPIPSLENAYKTANQGQGTPSAVINTGLTAAFDAAAPLGAGKIGEQLGTATDPLFNGVSRVVGSAKDNLSPLDEVGGINNTPVTPPDIPGVTPIPNTPPAPSDAVTPVDASPDAIMKKLATSPVANPEEGGVLPPTPEPLPVDTPAAPDDLLQSNSAAQEFDHDMQDPALDWSKVSGAQQELVDKISGVASQLKMADMKEADARAAAKAAPVKSLAEYKSMAAQQIAAHPENFDNVVARAKAEADYENFVKADKGLGYDKAKWQLPKGAPANPFIQNLFDKTHSPEFTAKSQAGALLGDTRDTIKGVQDKVNQAQKAFDKSVKTHTQTDAIRNELRSQKVRLTTLQEMERNHAKNYSVAKQALDDKYPDINLTAKRGVRITSSQPGFVTARSIPGEAESLDSTAPESEPTPVKPLEINLKDNPNAPNLNEGAFSAEDRANLEKQSAEEEANPPAMEGYRNADGDSAILEGIKRGDSDAALVKAYMDATGEDLEEAKKAVGIIEDNPHASKIGAVENNPLHDKIANPDVDTVNPNRLGKIFARSRTVRNLIINKALARATGFRNMLDYNQSVADRLWGKLTPAAQEAADSLRDHSPETVAENLPETDRAAFLDYANRASHVQDYIHEARRISDPYDITPYRQNYGAGFSSANPDGSEFEPSAPKEGQDHSYAEARHFNNYADLEETTGRVRTSANFHEDLTKDIGSAKTNITQHNLLYGLRQAFGDNAASYGGDKLAAHQALHDFNNVFTNKELADRINSKAMANYSDNIGGKVAKVYDIMNKAAKDAKLSGSGFHNINIELSHVGLDPLTAPKAMQAWGSPTAFLDSMDKWESDGTLQKALGSGLTLGAGDEFDSGINKIPGFKQLHAALFERQIVYSKLAVFDKFTKGLDMNNTDDFDKLMDASKGVNNMFGGVNRLLNGFTPTQFKWAARGILAVDYNEGQFRTLMAALDPRTLGTIEGRMARQMITTRAAMLATPGTLQAISNHQIGDNPKQVLKFVATQLVNPTVQTPWKTAGGTPKQINLLATVTNKVYRAVAPAFNKNNPDKLSGLSSEASGNLSAFAAFVKEEVNNADFYGAPMHGHGLTAGEDLGQALNAIAPIPFQPGARALENIPALANNKFVKIASGGQSAISPGEAAIDISGVGRVSANPTAPVMQIMNNRTLVREGLSADNQGALDQVEPSWNQNLSKAQVAAIYNNSNYEISKWTTMADNPAVLKALNEQNAFAKAHGEPSNPLYDLSAKDQQTLIRYEQLKSSDPGTDANDTAAVIYANNKELINTYENNVATYSTAMNKLYQSSGGLKGSTAPQITPGGVPYPVIPQATQNLVNQYYGMSSDTSTQRAQFLAQNPEVEQAFNAMFNYENARRAGLNEPLLKNYPTAPAALESWMTDYTNASKTERTSLRTANPTAFNDMQNYMASVDEYNLSLTAGQAKFVGDNLSQANLKSIYDLGQYDINPEVASDGTTDYSVNPAAAYANSSSGGGSSSEVTKLLDDMERSHAVAAVKYAGKKAYIRKAYKSKIFLPKPKMIRTKRPQGGKLKIKSVPISQ